MTAESQLMRPGEVAVGLRCKRGHPNGIRRYAVEDICQERNCGQPVFVAEHWELVRTGDGDLVPFETILVRTEL